MSPSHLPDDLEQWPNDPFALLGLDSNAAPTEIRRAYARLIRFYKPDDAPEHFQRVRQAYEMAMSYAAYRQSTGEEASEGEPTDGEAAQEGSKPPTPEQQRNADVLAIKREVDRLWTDSPDQLERLYREYAEMVAKFPDADEVYGRLYWLLSMSPELDPGREPVTWLTQGMLAMDAQGGLLQLYGQETIRRPGELLTPRCRSLLTDARSVVVELGAERWRLAGLAGDWELIVSDVEALRARVQSDDPHCWACLLLAAVDALAWQEVPSEDSASRRYFGEVERYAKEVAAFNEALTRCDYLFDLVSHWRLLQHLAAVPEWFRKTLRPLVREHWDRPVWRYRWDLLRCLSPLFDSDDPEKGFHVLDPLAGHAGMVFHCLRGMVAGLYAEQFGQQEPVDLAPLEEEGRRLLHWFTVQGYDPVRVEWLLFCARYHIGRESLLTLFSREAFARDAALNLSQHLTGDAVLDCLIQAGRAVWEGIEIREEASETP